MKSMDRVEAQKEGCVIVFEFAKAIGNVSIRVVLHKVCSRYINHADLSICRTIHDSEIEPKLPSQQ